MLAKILNIVQLDATPAKPTRPKPIDPSKAPASVTVLLSKGSSKKADSDASRLPHSDPYTAGSASIAALRKKLHQRFDIYAANTRKAHPKDARMANAELIAAAVPPANGLNGSIPLVDQGAELLWTGEVSIGTPGVVVPLDFDTGSSDLFIQPGQYQPNLSSTARNTKKAFKLGYGDGTSASGAVYTETVRISNITITQQAIGNATRSTLGEDGSQGIAGMGFPSIAQFKRPPFFQTMIDQKAVVSPVFCFGLWTRNARLDLGHIEPSVYSGQIAYSPVSDAEGFWETSFAVNGAPQRGIIDTGTTLIIGPKDAVASLFRNAGVSVTEQNGEVYGVYKTSSPPRITFEFGGQNYVLSPEALSYTADGDNTIASIIGADLGMGQSWIVGDSFLQDVYAVFDYGKKRVGFAPRAH